MFQIEKPLSSSDTFQPWTYPPQFDLLVAPLALMPLGLAYSVFMIGTLAAYLATLRRIATEKLCAILILLAPVIVITIRCGQNGFLTGTLIGLTCIGLQTGRSLAGLPLGLMIIKPTSQWASQSTRLSIGAGERLLSLLRPSRQPQHSPPFLLGPAVWTAFLDGVTEARVFLEHGFYPFFRMISLYAVVRTFGFSALVATTRRSSSPFSPLA